MNKSDKIAEYAADAISLQIHDLVKKEILNVVGEFQDNLILEFPEQIEVSIKCGTSNVKAAKYLQLLLGLRTEAAMCIVMLVRTNTMTFTNAYEDASNNVLLKN